MYTLIHVPEMDKIVGGLGFEEATVNEFTRPSRDSSPPPPQEMNAIKRSLAGDLTCDQWCGVPELPSQSNEGSHLLIGTEIVTVLSREGNYFAEKTETFFCNSRNFVKRGLS